MPNCDDEQAAVDRAKALRNALNTALEIVNDLIPDLEELLEECQGTSSEESSGSPGSEEESGSV